MTSNSGHQEYTLLRLFSKADFSITFKARIINTLQILQRKLTETAVQQAKEIIKAIMEPLQYRLWSTLFILTIFFILITINAYSNLDRSELDTTIEKQFLITATVLGPFVILLSIYLTHKLAG